MGNWISMCRGKNKELNKPKKKVVNDVLRSQNDDDSIFDGGSYRTSIENENAIVSFDQSSEDCATFTKTRTVSSSSTAEINNLMLLQQSKEQRGLCGKNSDSMRVESGSREQSMRMSYWQSQQSQSQEQDAFQEHPCNKGEDVLILEESCLPT